MSQTFAVEPWSKVKANVRVTAGDWKIPFVVHYKSRETGQKAKAWGVWNGTVSWKLETVIETIERFDPK